jgi:hypothetical protein
MLCTQAGPPLTGATGGGRHTMWIWDMNAKPTMASGWSFTQSGQRLECVRVP